MTRPCPDTGHVSILAGMRAIGHNRRGGTLCQVHFADLERLAERLIAECDHVGRLGPPLDGHDGRWCAMCGVIVGSKA